MGSPCRCRDGRRRGLVHTVDRNPDPNVRRIQEMRRGGATDPTTQVVHHHTALFAWQLALIIVAAALLLAMTGALASRRARNGSHRPAIS